MAACPDEMKVQTFLLLFPFLYVQSCWKTNQAVWHQAQEGDAKCYLPVLRWLGSFVTKKNREKNTPTLKKLFQAKSWKERS